MPAHQLWIRDPSSLWVEAEGEVFTSNLLLFWLVIDQKAIKRCPVPKMNECSPLHSEMVFPLISSQRLVSYTNFCRVVIFFLSKQVRFPSGFLCRMGVHNLYSYFIIASSSWVRLLIDNNYICRRRSIFFTCFNICCYLLWLLNLRLMNNFD